MKLKTEYVHKTKAGYTVFAYIIAGQGNFCSDNDPFCYEMKGANYFDIKQPEELSNEMLVLFEDGDEIKVTTGASSVRFLLISGKPLNEPIAWYGPIVMNTQEELRTAFEEYQNGTFIKHGK